MVSRKYLRALLEDILDFITSYFLTILVIAFIIGGILAFFLLSYAPPAPPTPEPPFPHMRP